MSSLSPSDPNAVVPSADEPRGWHRVYRRLRLPAALLPWLRRRGPTLLIVLLLALTLGVRLLRSHHGLPYVDHWDEPTLANRSLLMLKSGELGPGFFKYPSLLLYLNMGVDAAHFLRLAALPEDHPDSLTSLDDLEIGQPSAEWYVSHPSFYVWKRWLVSLFGFAMVIAAARLAAAMSSGPTAPLLAILLLGTLYLHIWHSTVVTTDVPAACLAVFAVLFCLRFARQERPGQLLAAAALAGLAASTKYNLGVVAVFVLGSLLLAAWRRSDGYRPWLWLAIPATIGATFLAGTPYALLDLRTFLDHVAYEVHHYTVAGHGSSTAVPGWPHLRLDLADLAHHLGFVPFALGVAGLALCLRRPGGWLLVAPPALQLFLTTGTTVHFHRNLMLLYPFLAAGFGIAVAALVRTLRRRLADTRWRPLPGVLLVTIAGGWGILQAREALFVGWRSLGATDSRSRVVRALDRLDDVREVWLARELRWHPRDLDHLSLPFRLLPTLEALCRPRPPGTVAVTGGDYHYLAPGGEAQEETLAAAVGDLSEARTVGGGRTYLDRYSVDPLLAVWEHATARDREVCAVLSPPRLAADSPGRADGSGLWLPAGETVETAPLPIYPTSYVLTWNEKELAVERGVLHLEVLFTPHGSGEPEVVTGRPYRTRPSGRDRRLSFRLDERGSVVLRLRADGDEPGSEVVWVRQLGFSFAGEGPSRR